MNWIFWFIYLSDVIGNIQPTLGIGGGLLIVAAGFCLLISSVEDWEPGPRIAKKTCITGIVAIFIACMIPSKTTMYAIAASQLGEAALATPEAKEMIDDTKQILRDYLKSLKKDGSK